MSKTLPASSAPRNQIKTLNSIRIKLPDITDEQIWIQSTAAQTWRLIRGIEDDFSFSETDLVMLTNRAESECATCFLEGISCPDGAIYIGSNRRAGLLLRAGERRALVLKPREVLTLRSICAREPRTGTPIQIGQHSPS
jgi:hypothetical protein